MQEDIKVLITYLVEKHFGAFEGVTYVQTFKALRQRYDQRADHTVITDRSRPHCLSSALASHAPPTADHAHIHTPLSIQSCLSQFVNSVPINLLSQTESCLDLSTGDYTEHMTCRSFTHFSTSTHH